MKRKQTNEYTNDKRIYAPNEIDLVLDIALSENDVRKTHKKIEYYNVPCAFDIETTSFYIDAEHAAYQYEDAKRLTERGVPLDKVAIMYVWQFGINGHVVVGRTWQEFEDMITYISTARQLSVNKRLVVYVHNLAYEFQYIRKRFTWHNVFSGDIRKPIYAVTTTGVEFRCSYYLSGYSLETVGKNLHKYKVEKLVGGLDYDKLRHSYTPLTENEMQYCINDVYVVMSYIKEQIEDVGNITHLPITKTGYVRKYCKKQCLRTKDANGKTVNNQKYISLMHKLTIDGPNEFTMLQRAFCGGFTHSNGHNSRIVLHDVASYDFTSAYPYVMLSERFPMSKGKKIQCKSIAQFDFVRSKFLCIFDIEFNYIHNVANESYISTSKCFVTENVASNNGRVVSASRIVTTITNIDFDVIKNVYMWDSYRIGDMYIYNGEYLPTEFVKSILHLYKNKTELKGVVGMEKEYLNSKEMLNSCYGMCVTSPLRDDVLYENDVWDVSVLSPEARQDAIEKYNESKNRFLYYPWGVFVTAYCRRNLFTAIISCGDDYVYSDTDSIKLLNHDAHKQYFEEYNKRVHYKLRCAAKYHGIEFSDFEPKTKNGVNKLIGVWDFEGVYNRFKTLGAKRYLTETNGTFAITTSGVTKSCINSLVARFGENGVFDAFDDYLEILPTETGKKLHTYIEFEQNGYLSDYTGIISDYHELSSVHLEPTGYNLSLSANYLQYLIGIDNYSKLFK